MPQWELPKYFFKTKDAWNSKKKKIFFGVPAVAQWDGLASLEHQDAGSIPSPA